MADPIINPALIQPGTTTPVEQHKAQEQQQKQEAKPEPHKPDQFQTPLSQKAMQARQMMQPGAELGHKVTYQQVPRHSMPAPQQQQKPAPQTTPDHYRQVSQDRVFRQPAMQDSPMYRHVQQRSLPQSQQQSHLSRQQLSQMIAMRNQAENKEAYRQVLRQEIHEKKQEARRTDEAMKKGAPGSETADAFAGKQSNFMSKLAQGEEGFENLLKKMMAGEQGLPETPQGKTANLLAKSGASWETMFANMAKMGNVATEASVKAQQLLQSFFRGLYQQATKGMTLVSDLHYLGDAQQVIAEKFARILVDNPDLLRMLEQLSPGDPIPDEILKALGEDINFTQMTHTPDQMTDEARQLARDAAFATLRNPVNTSAQDRLSEKMRRSREKVDRDAEEGGFGGFHSGEEEVPFKGPLYDPRWERQERFGKPKGWIFFTAALGSIIFFLLAFVFGRKFF